jgi:hypothetical protein
MLGTRILPRKKRRELTKKGRYLLNVKTVTAGVIVVLSLQLSGDAQQGKGAQQTTSQSTLVVNTIAPSAGTQLTKKAVIVANLSYNIAHFENGRYTIFAQFETKGGKITTDGDFPSADYPSLTEPSGQLNFSFPIKYVWNHKEVKRPFVVWFYLMKWRDSSSSTGVARAGPVEFQAQ